MRCLVFAGNFYVTLQHYKAVFAFKMCEDAVKGTVAGSGKDTSMLVVGGGIDSMCPVASHFTTTIHIGVSCAHDPPV